MINKYIYIILFIYDSETQLVHKEHTVDKMMQECLDVAKKLCVPDPLETVEEQHLQNTEAFNTSFSALSSSSLPESSQSEIFGG